MPELPEVETIKRELSRKIVGKTIKNVGVRLPRMVAIGPKTLSQFRKGSSARAKDFSAFLSGKKILNIDRRAKLLILQCSRRWNLLIHLKLTGQLIFRKSGDFSPAGKFTHVIFTFRDGSRLFYNDLRQFGYLRLVKNQDLIKVKELQSFGPEPLGKNFTPEIFTKILASRPKRKLKDLLLDQQAIAGIGNIYADEILFAACLAPTRLTSSLLPQETSKLHQSIQKILRFAILQKGSSSRNYRRPNGKEGDFVRFHKVYQRTGESCFRCTSSIKRRVLAGRGSHFCPTCQK